MKADFPANEAEDQFGMRKDPGRSGGLRAAHRGDVFGAARTGRTADRSPEESRRCQLTDSTPGSMNRRGLLLASATGIVDLIRATEAYQIIDAALPSGPVRSVGDSGRAEGPESPHRGLVSHRAASKCPLNRRRTPVNHTRPVSRSMDQDLPAMKPESLNE
jgi:hypothetical protein